MTTPNEPSGEVEVAEEIVRVLGACYPGLDTNPPMVVKIAAILARHRAPAVGAVSGATRVQNLMLTTGLSREEAREILAEADAEAALAAVRAVIGEGAG